VGNEEVHNSYSTSFQDIGNFPIPVSAFHLFLGQPTSPLTLCATQSFFWYSRIIHSSQMLQTPAQY